MDLYESSSSDSCGEQLKNVSSLVVKSRDSRRDLDENYAYKRRLGDLIFDANFEGANLGHVEQVDAHNYDLMVRPDVANPRHRIWFNFKVHNQRPGQCVVFTFVNLSESLALRSECLTPVVRCQSRPNWVRLKSSQVFHYRSANHNNLKVMSVAFRFTNHHDDEHQFALFYPYTITTLTEFLDRWHVQLKRHQADQADRSSAQVLAWSVLSKPIYMLQTPTPNSTDKVKLSAVVMVRKSGNFESPASWLAHGLMDYILSDDPVAATARGRIHLTVFPMIDPDSRWVGNSRTDIMGQSSVDSQLIEPNPRLYEAHRLVEKQIDSICSSAWQRQQSVVVIELQVCPNLTGARMIGSAFADSLRMERHMHLPRLMSRFCESFYLEKCEFSSTSNRTRDQLDTYRLDISPSGYHKRSLLDNTCRPYEQRDYLLLGKALVFALLEHSCPDSKQKGDLPDRVCQSLAAFRHSHADVDDLELVNRINT